jgi:hypothetical protein
VDYAPAANITRARYIAMISRQRRDAPYEDDQRHRRSPSPPSPTNSIAATTPRDNSQQLALRQQQQSSATLSSRSIPIFGSPDDISSTDLGRHPVTRARTLPTRPIPAQSTSSPSKRMIVSDDETSTADRAPAMSSVIPMSSASAAPLVSSSSLASKGTAAATTPLRNPNVSTTGDEHENDDNGDNYSGSARTRTAGDASENWMESAVGGDDDDYSDPNTNSAAPLPTNDNRGGRNGEGDADSSSSSGACMLLRKTRKLDAPVLANSSTEFAARRSVIEQVR